MAFADIPEDFIQTYMMHGNRIVHVSLCGVLADLLAEIDPEKPNLLEVSVRCTGILGL